MTISFQYNQSEVKSLIAELEEKGMTDLAQRIRTSTSHYFENKTRQMALKSFKKEWTDGYYFCHADGKITCIYWSYPRKCYSLKPVYESDILMGKARTLGEIKDMIETFKEVGFEEV